MAPGPAAGADVQTAQSHLVADLLRVLVLLGPDRVTAPANDQIRARLVIEHARIAQDVEDRIGHRSGVGKVEAAAGNDFVRDEHHVAQHRKQVLLDAADHLAIDEGRCRGIAHLELDAPGLPQDLNVEIPIAIEDLLGIVGVRAAVEHRQRALAKQGIQAALAGVQEFADLVLGKILETAPRRDTRVDEFGDDDAAIH